MKTVTGKITSSTPIPITKAASILSKFVSAETGASQAVNAYLRRATAAIDELVRLHSKSDRRKHKRHRAVGAATSAEEIPTQSVDVSQELKKVEWMADGVETKRKEGKEKSDFRSKGDDEGRVANYVKQAQNQGEGDVAEDIQRKKKDRKKEKEKKRDLGSSMHNAHKLGTEIKEEQSLGNSDMIVATEREAHKKKKKKRERTSLGNSEENGVEAGLRESRGKMEINEEEKKTDGFINFKENGDKAKIGEEKFKRKKRKSGDVDQEMRDGLDEESHDTKKEERWSRE